ncbi:MAG: hypothetical protein GX895_14210 [Clostridiales bacterium]|uniref:hypothetical protein n=1 Tax=Clostridium sp. N3C TaxID=1776758 RepID=UPI00092E15F8|nr:hypothetical protein [Clostridium sp. N3C]NLZ49907.1 hypothetical protein [Clostridiales bacterium]SCN26123.1 hypothetical protein N3C_2686 [Clostridium sp. N3C]
MKRIRVILIAIILIVFFIVMVNDLGDHTNKPGGAGEIWWTQVPQIDETYRKLNKR